jgi:GAF domain-containing protein
MVTLDNGIQADMSLEMLMRQSLPLVAAGVSAQSVSIYRVVGQTARLVASQSADAPAERPVTDAHRMMLQSGEPLRDQARWTTPILRDAWVFGWLEVDSPGVADAADVLSVIAYVLTQAIEQTEASGFTADNLVLSSRLITTADNYSDMVQAAVYTIARSMAGVAMTLFDHPLDLNDVPNARAVVALGAPEGPQDIRNVTYFAELPDDDQLKSLWRGLPVIIQDFHASGFALSAHYLPLTKVKWLAAFGLRASDRVLGTLEILHHEPYQLLPEEIDAYATLADQMGVAVRNRQLLRQTSDALDEVKTLYEVNRAMIAAQDRLDVLRALYSLSPDAMNISHLAVKHASSSDPTITDLIVSHSLTADGEQVSRISLAEMAGNSAIVFAQQFWQDTTRPVMFVEDVAAPSNGVPAEMRIMAQESGTSSMVVVPIYERSRLQDLITIGFAQTRAFDSAIRRLYEALADQISVVFQNQRLLQETQISTVELSSQVRVLQTLNNLASSVAAAREESTLLEEVTRALVTALNLDAAHVLLLTPSRQTLVVAGEYPMDGGVGREFDVHTVPFFERVVATNSREPIVVSDVEADARMTDAQRDLYRAINIRSMISVPMYVQNDLIGAVGLELRQSGRQFSEAAVDIARTITTQLVVALQNIRLLNSAQQQAEQLQRASSFNQQLQATLDLQAVLEKMVTQSRQIIDFDCLIVALAGDEGDSGTLYTAAFYNHGESTVTPQVGEPILLEDSIFGRVWDTQAFVHVPNLQIEVHRYARRGLPPELRSLMSAPIFARGRLLGVVLIGSDQPYYYTDVDQVVFGNIVNQIGVAIDNSSVYDQSRRIAMNEALVNDISARLQQQVDIPSLMNVAVNELGRALGARRARVRLGTTSGDER